jgi:hypothetical protein
MEVPMHTSVWMHPKSHENEIFLLGHTLVLGTFLMSPLHC